MPIWWVITSCGFLRVDLSFCFFGRWVDMGAYQVDSNHFGLVCEVAKPDHLPMWQNPTIYLCVMHYFPMMFELDSNISKEHLQKYPKDPYLVPARRGWLLFISLRFSNLLLCFFRGSQLLVLTPPKFNMVHLKMIVSTFGISFCLGADFQVPLNFRVCKWKTRLLLSRKKLP